MGINFELSDLPPSLRKQAMRQLAKEDARSGKKQKKIWEIEAETETGIAAKNTEKPNRSKYNSEKITTVLYDGTEHTFDSKKEYRRYQELEIMQLAGEIGELKLQVPYELLPKQKLSNGKTERAVMYIADFVYTENENTIVEDVKGYRDGGAYRVFSLKRKMMKFFHNIEIREV